MLLNSYLSHIITKSVDSEVISFLPDCFVPFATQTCWGVIDILTIISISQFSLLFEANYVIIPE
jgi:hypothetical protein